MDLEIYKRASEEYRPEKIKVLFIAESPPPSKKGDKPRYFYFVENRGPDLLFSTVVKAIYNFNYRRSSNEKEKLLERMKDDGYFLVDACDRSLERNEDKESQIMKNLPRLLQRMKELDGHGLKIILIKNIVFDLLREPLRKEGFNVLNKGRIGFPRYYNDRQTVRRIRVLLWDKIGT